MKQRRTAGKSRALLGLAILACAWSFRSSANTNSYWFDLEKTPRAYNSFYQISLFNPSHGEDSARVWSQTKSVFIYGFGVLGILFALPEDNTGWEKDPDIFRKWVDNVTAGPEWDRNNWAYNYIGHTYFGGVYYQIARKSGYRQWDSFIYTFLMSTFYWEFGIEALAEVPSVQDLAFTPLAGWVYGEWAYQTERNIRASNNEVLGSPALGKVSLALLDPVDGLGNLVNHLAGRDWIKAGYGYVTYTPTSFDGKTDHLLYLHLRMPLGAAGPALSKTKELPKQTSDPVDTGIVGVSVGPAYVMPDKDWNVDGGLATRVTMGLYFTPRTSLRLAYTRGELDQQGAEGEITFENYSLDGQIYFAGEKNIRPYLSAGLGEQIWNKDEEQTMFQWNCGLGLHVKLHRKLALQFDWTNYYGPSKDMYDQQVFTGIVYRFGRGEHDDW